MGIVLVVDDEEPNRKLLGTVPARDGPQVTVAPSAEVPQEPLSADLSELIPVDVRLLGMDGLELTRLLKASARTGSVPVISISAHGFEADKRNAPDGGAPPTSPDPLDIRELADHIRRVPESTPRAGFHG